MKLIIFIFGKKYYGEQNALVFQDDIVLKEYVLSSYVNWVPIGFLYVFSYT